MDRTKKNDRNNQNTIMEQKLIPSRETDNDYIDRENDELWLAIIKRIRNIIRIQKKI